MTVLMQCRKKYIKKTVHIYIPTETADSADKATTAPNIPTDAVEI